MQSEVEQGRAEQSSEACAMRRDGGGVPGGASVEGKMVSLVCCEK
jgi:hypothetical protein